MAISRGTNSSYPAALTFGSGSTWSSLLTRTAGSGSMVDFTATIPRPRRSRRQLRRRRPAAFRHRRLGQHAGRLDRGQRPRFRRLHSTSRHLRNGQYAVTALRRPGRRSGQRQRADQRHAQTSAATKTINSLVVQSAVVASEHLDRHAHHHEQRRVGTPLDANGGILVSGASDFTANGGYTITGGTITSGVSGTNSELFTWIDSGTTTINSVIANIGGGGTTSLALGGSGTLVLGGANTFSGGHLRQHGRAATEQRQRAGPRRLFAHGPRRRHFGHRRPGPERQQLRALRGGQRQRQAAGAIINSGAAESNALRTIALAGNAAFGGANEWDLRVDALALPFSSSSFDLVICNLLTHHLEPEELLRFLNEALRVCRIAALIGDLRRNRLHWALAYAGGVLFRSRITRHDAVASVRRAYTAQEWAALVHQVPAASASIESYSPFRLGITLWKNCDG